MRTQVSRLDAPSGRGARGSIFVSPTVRKRGPFGSIFTASNPKLCVHPWLHNSFCLCRPLTLVARKPWSPFAALLSRTWLWIYVAKIVEVPPKNVISIAPTRLINCKRFIANISKYIDYVSTVRKIRQLSIDNWQPIANEYTRRFQETRRVIVVPTNPLTSLFEWRSLQ